MALSRICAREACLTEFCEARVKKQPIKCMNLLYTVQSVLQFNLDSNKKLTRTIPGVSDLGQMGQRLFCSTVLNQQCRLTTNVDATTLQQCKLEQQRLCLLEICSVNTVYRLLTRLKISGSGQ